MIATGGVVAKRVVLNVAMNSSTGFASPLKKGVEEKEGKKNQDYLYVKIHHLHVIEK